MKNYIDILEFMISKILKSKNNLEQDLNIRYDERYINLSYTINGYNNSKREYSLTIPRFISNNERTFEVLGLLQAEMGKTHNGSLSFANSEPKIVNYVLNWFEKELEFNKNTWKWSIKLNINEPKDLNYKKEIEDKVKNYWLRKTKLTLEQAYPKKITYIKNTENIVLKLNDHGSLVLEHKNNLFSQIIKNFVKKITYEKITTYKKELIRAYIKGIIAGEGTVANHIKSRHRGVHISACEQKEREIFKNCLDKVDVKVKVYEDYKEMLISKRENLIKLLNQRLMTLHPKKYNKFLNMMKQYPNIEKETNYFRGNRQNVWNKIPQERINQVIELYKSGTIRTKEIAEKLNISEIKVNRVLKENNLGRRVKKTPESLRKEIAKFTKDNPKLSLTKIAEYFRVHKSVVVRSYRKYYGERGQVVNRRIPEDKIQRIIQIYKEKPAVKILEVAKEVGVSDTVVRRIRKENNLEHLGFMHLIGNNNRKHKEKEQKSWGAFMEA